MLSLLKGKGYRQVSLSVQKDNYAVRLYEGLGFETVKTTDGDCLMLCSFDEGANSGTSRLVSAPPTYSSAALRGISEVLLRLGTLPCGLGLPEVKLQLVAADVLGLLLQPYLVDDPRHRILAI